MKIARKHAEMVTMKEGGANKMNCGGIESAMMLGDRGQATVHGELSVGDILVVINAGVFLAITCIDSVHVVHPRAATSCRAQSLCLMRLYDVVLTPGDSRHHLLCLVVRN